MRTKKFLSFETYYLIALIFLAFIVRFLGLGYSHYYGDEVKTLYLDKTIPAVEFLLDQRKGPVQFLVTWFMEKLSGGYNEFWIRLPYCLASTLSVLFFYLFVKRFLNKNASYFASAIYAFSGFSVAFGRTAQYQSFLLLFGFVSLYLICKFKDTSKRQFLFLSSVFWALAVFSHYDGVFFLVPLFLIHSGTRLSKKGIEEFLLNFIFPSFILLSTFYLPYLIRGYLSSNTLNYVLKRVSGEGYLENNSFYTINVYNPFLIFYLLLSPALLAFKKMKDIKVNILLAWFIATFIFYEIVITNPGTHIQHYLTPLIIISGFVLSDIRSIRKYLLIPLFVIYILVSFFVFVPGINNGYPWKNAEILGINVKRIEGRYQLFLYGFLYNRAWNSISEYMLNKDGVRGFYTNDNDSFSDYYLLGLDYTPPGSNFLPQYYIHVYNNQEVSNQKEDFILKNNDYYEKEKEFFLDGELVSAIYRRK